MKALILVDDNPEKLIISSIDKPQLKPKHALVKIKAAALNRRDQWCREGLYPNITYNTVLGSDACGVVEEVHDVNDQSWLNTEVVINPNIHWGNNPNVQSKAYQVLGMPSQGTLAEYILVPVDRLQKKPKHLSVEQAAAIPLAGLTAFRALFFHGRFDSSKKILITGAGGGVAQFAALFAHAIGKEVYISSGNNQKLDYFHKIGIKGFNYKDENWSKTAHEVTQGFDLIIDSAGGNTLNELIKLVKPAGKIVFYGATLGRPANIDVHRMFWNQITLQGTTMGNDQEFRAMIAYIEKHEITPIIDKVWPFNTSIDAFNAMKANQHFGKIVISI